MNKAELLETVVAKKPYRTRAGEVKEIVNTTLETIAGALAKGENVKIVDFGTFKINERAARTGRNPRTGAEMNIPAQKAVSFKPGKALKEAVK